MALTRRQREVLDVIREFIEKQGYSPSLEEIGSALGLSSVATVHKHVSLLVEKGFVQRTWNQNRSIELIESDAPGLALLPLKGNLRAGAPIEAPSTAETIRVPTEMLRDRERAYVLRVRGDSMVDEQVRDGDLVIVEGRESASNGDTVVALIGGEQARLARIFMDGSLVRLESSNPAVKPLVASRNEVRVHAVALGIIRTL